VPKKNEASGKFRIFCRKNFVIYTDHLVVLKYRNMGAHGLGMLTSFRGTRSVYRIFVGKHFEELSL